MKNTRIISAACILASLILLAGCQKGLGDFGGQSVRFGATTKGSTTKAAYSGAGTFSNGFLTWERIEWESTDRIRVASNYAYCKDHGAGSSTPLNSHYADYTLSGINNPTDDPKISKATMAPLNTTSNGLVWDDAHESGYAFYAVSPCPLDNTNISLESGDAEGETLGKVTATLPSVQTLASSSTPRYVSSTGAVADDQGKPFAAAQTNGYTYNVYAPDKNIMFLTAATGKKDSYKSGEVVDLVFKPAFTAFEFHITTQDQEGLTIKKIALVAGEDEYLAGQYTSTAGSVDGAALVNDSKIEANRTVSLSFGTDGVGVTTTTGVAVSLLTVPVANTKAITLKITDDTGAVASLPLTYSGKVAGHNAGDPYLFTPGTKYRVNLLKVAGKWKISIAPDVDPWDDEAISIEVTAPSKLNPSFDQPFNEEEDL